MPLTKVTIRGTHWENDSSSADVLHADEPHALVMAAGYLKFNRSGNGEGIYFRGQRKHYGTLIPSLFRESTSQKSQEKKIIALNQTIRTFRSEGPIFSGFGEYAHEPLLQHYGINTTWVDLVDNVWVALWFACHRALISGKHGQYLHFEKRIPTDTEKYAYILLVSADITTRNRNKPGYYSGPNTELIDLRMAAPSVFLRPHSQHGLLFRKKGTPGNGRPLDYSDQILGVVRVDLSKALNWVGEGKMVGIHSLFPPPYYDSGYQILLSCPADKKLGIGNIAHIGA